MPEEIKDLLELPWQSLLAIAAGYLAYYVANVGLREHHKTIDIAFSTAVFGLLAVGYYRWATEGGNLGEPLASVTTVLLAIVLGGLWSRVGRKAARWSFRSFGLSHADDGSNVLARLFGETGFDATQLTVRLASGTWLMCDDLHRFKDQPNGPCVIGDDGGVLLYVTDEKVAGSEEFTKVESVTDREWGAEITYVPPSQIERLYLRRASRR